MTKNGIKLFDESQDYKTYRKEFQLKEAIRIANQDIDVLKNTIEIYVETNFKPDDEESSQKLNRKNSLTQAVSALQHFYVRFKTDNVILFCLPKYCTDPNVIEGMAYEVKNDEKRVLEAIELLEIFKTQLYEIKKLIVTNYKPNYVTNKFIDALSSVNKLEKAFLDYMEIEISNYYPI